jgi:FkbM family methyltransferase
MSDRRRRVTKSERLARRWRRSPPEWPNALNVTMHFAIPGARTLAAPVHSWGRRIMTVELRGLPVRLFVPRRLRTVLRRVPALEWAARTVLPDGVQRQLRAALVAKERQEFPERIVQHTYGGVALEVIIADPTGEAWYDKDWPPLPEVELLRRHGLLAGARVFDLGAHQGIVALMLADAVGTEGRVLAVEASAHDAALALRNARANGAANVEVMQAAVARHSGRLTFSASGEVVGGGAAESTIVDAVSVDDLSARHGQPDVLFIDVEGFELEVLAGALGTLTGMTDCFVEVHAGGNLERFGGSCERLLSFFPRNCFDLYVRGENDEHFRLLPRAAIPAPRRFFLVAMSRAR